MSTAIQTIRPAQTVIAHALIEVANVALKVTALGEDHRAVAWDRAGNHNFFLSDANVRRIRLYARETPVKRRLFLFTYGDSKTAKWFSTEAKGEVVSAGEPLFGAVGTDTAAVCSCGAGPHAELRDRCAGGHVIRGNATALVVGERSLRFWAASAAARQEIEHAAIADAGHTPEDVPKALQLVASGLAQAVLIRDSAFERLAHEGGALTASGRARRCLAVWAAAADRVERYARLLGLRRVSKPTPDLHTWLRERAEAQLAGPEQRDDRAEPQLIDEHGVDADEA